MNAHEFYKKLGPNFVTPNVISYTESKHYYIELSTGEILGCTLYGVTVRNEDKEDPYNLSKSFNSLEAAKKYIHEIVMDDKNGEYEDNSTKG